MDVIVEDLPEQQAPIVGSDPHTVSNPVEHLALSQRFNIQTPTKEEDGMLQEIWSYVKAKKGDVPIHDVVWEVINLEQTLGAPRLGETRLNKLYRYVRLRTEEQRIQSQLKSL